MTPRGRGGRRLAQPRRAARIRAAFAVCVWAILASAAARAEEPRDAGERAFLKCYSCHSVDPQETGLSGPSLFGVVGRRAAALADFPYSPAMKRAAARGLVWTEDALDRYLADPLEAISGTTMSFPGLRDAGERRQIIAYLRRFR